VKSIPGGLFPERSGRKVAIWEVGVILLTLASVKAIIDNVQNIPSFANDH